MDFCPGVPVFPSPKIQTFLKFHFDPEFSTRDHGISVNDILLSSSAVLELQAHILACKTLDWVHNQGTCRIGRI